MCGVTPKALQASLVVGSANDPLEREADRIADTVMRMPSRNERVQPEREIQARTSQHQQSDAHFRVSARSIPASASDCVSGESAQLTGRERGVWHPSLLQERPGPGASLPGEARGFFETRMGVDLGAIRVHTGRGAERLSYAIGARAFTVGRDIFFGRNQFDVMSARGKRLIAHELAHAMQQRATGPARVASSVDTGGYLRRACGHVEVGSVPGCRGGTGDVIGDTVRFNAGCDTFLEGEREGWETLASFVSTLAPQERLEVHGFASEEGPPDFNEDLSCLRARKAKSILVLLGIEPARIAALVQHGATSGVREERRSVVLVRIGAANGKRATFEQAAGPESLPGEGLLERERFDALELNLDPRSTAARALDTVLDVVTIADTVSNLAQLSGTVGELASNPGAIGTALSVLGLAGVFAQALGFMVVVGNRQDDIEQAVATRGFAYGFVAAAIGVSVGEPGLGGKVTRASFAEGRLHGARAFEDALASRQPAVRRAAQEIRVILRAGGKQAIETALNEVHQEAVRQILSEDALFGLLHAISPIGQQEQSCRLSWPGPRWGGSPGAVCVIP